MSGGSDVGYYALPIIPSFEGGIKAIDGQLGKAFAGVSKSASQAIAGGVRDGVAAAEAAVKKSSDNIAKLRDKEAAAADKLRVAEERIAEVREKGGSSLARAEGQRNAAQRAQSAALREIETHTKSLESAQRRLDNAQRDVAKGPSGSAGGWLDKIKSKASEAVEALQGIGESSLSGMASGGSGAGASFLEGFSGEISSIGSKAGPIGIAITAAAGVALAGGALIAQQVFAGMEQEQQQANVQAKLGVDDVTMKRIADAAGKAYAGNFGESVAGNMDAARAAIQSGLLGENASGADTQKTIEQLSTVASIMDTDIPEAARAAGQLIKTGLAGNATQALDLVTKGTQKGLNVSEDWLDTISEYSTQWRKLGLTGAETLGLLSQGLKGGARDTDVVADAIKEFTVQVVPGVKPAAAALKDLGLNVDDTLAKFAQGGTAAHDAFADVLNRLNQIDDPVRKNTDGLGLFATKWEDLGAAAQSLDLSTATQQLGEVEGATKRAADTVGGTAASSWESMKRTIEVALASVQLSLAKAFGPQLKNLADGVVEHKTEIVDAFVAIGQGAITFAEVTIKMLGATAGSFGELIAPIGDVIGAVAKGQAALADFQGNHEEADKLREQAEGYFSMGDGLKHVAEMAQNFNADGLRSGLQNAADAAKAADSNVAGLDLALAGLSATKVPPINVEVNAKPGGGAAWGPGGNITIPVLMGLQAPPGPGSTAVPGDPGSLIMPRASGGIDGMGQEAHIGDAVYPNGLVRYREPSTGGEAYIPLKGGDRSVDIWQETGRRLGVWKFEQGGFDGPDVIAAERMLGTKYSQGDRTDCSGMAARVINRALGLPDTGLMSTKNAAKWLADRGFKPGLGGPGTISVGWYDHGPNPNDGHMALTLSDGSPAEAGGSHGTFLVGAGAAGADSPQFDQHMFLPNLYGEGQGGSGSAGFSDGTGGYSLGGGTPGVGPNGEAGSYSAPDGKALREAQQKVADADVRVKEAEAKQKELEADAKESQKISAQADVDKAKREAQDARADLSTVQKGKFTAGTGKGGGGKGQGGMGQLGPLGDILGGFFKETLGLDGSFLPDISNLMPVQMAGGLLNAFKGPLQGAIDGQLGIQQPGWQPGMPVNGVEAPSASGLPFGMVPSPFDFAGSAKPGMAGPDGAHLGTGAAPGPVDQSRNVSIQVDSGPTSGEIGDTVRKEVNNVDRLHTYMPKGQ